MNPPAVAEAVESKPLTAKDFKTSQEVRWCPGCGDYSILNQFQKVLADLGEPKENHVLVSGIGCSSRFPYYVDTYGIHSIHGRAPTIATGVKALRPGLTVWVITGDGDGFSIGGNHMMHLLRRNVNVKVLLFNNQIYGLTKGQYSPTSEVNKRTKSSPLGSIEAPLDPLNIALTSGASFVARTVDRDGAHLYKMLKRAAEHQGTAFVEIYQNCPVFNDGAFEHLTDKSRKAETVLYLEAGEPLVFGAERDKGITLDHALQPQIVAADDESVLVMNEQAPLVAQLIAELKHPDFPTPVGVFHAEERAVYEQELQARVGNDGRIPTDSLQSLLDAGDTWQVD